MGESGDGAAQDDAGIEYRPGERTPLVRWRRAPFAILVVVVLAAGGTVVIRWWSNGCHDDYCTGSRHRVTVIVEAESPSACLENVRAVRTGDRIWYSADHAPAEWGSGAEPSAVPGTLVVMSTHEPISPWTHGGRRAMFTADQGGSVIFTGGTADAMSMLQCSVH